MRQYARIFAFVGLVAAIGLAGVITARAAEQTQPNVSVIAFSAI